MKKIWLPLFLISALLFPNAIALAQENAAQENAAAESDDPLVEGLPDDVPAPKKKVKPAKKTVKKKKNTKRKKSKRKKKIYVDEYKFKTYEFGAPPVSYKFDRHGDPIFSNQLNINAASKPRQFGKDYSKAWKNQPSIKTKRGQKKNYTKPNAFDDNSKSRQSEELTLPDGLGQPNGLIVVDPIIEEQPQ